MSIKHFLLGSSAVLAGVGAPVSGAVAADAVMADEAMTQVRVCDMYGSGFFYLPGTETCLKLYGNFTMEVNDGTGWFARTRLGTIANSETEFGTLSWDSRVEFKQEAKENETGFDGSAGLNYSHISVAGLSMGYGTTKLSSGYFHAAPLTTKALFVDYGFSAGNFTLNAGVEANAKAGTKRHPNPYAKLGFSAGGADIAVFGVQDTLNDETAFGVHGKYGIGALTLTGFYVSGEGTNYVGDGCSLADTLINPLPIESVQVCDDDLIGVRLDADLGNGFSVFGRWTSTSRTASYTNTDNPGLNSPRNAADLTKWRVGANWSVAGLSIGIHHTVSDLSVGPIFTAVNNPLSHFRAMEDDGVTVIEIGRSF